MEQNLKKLAAEIVYSALTAVDPYRAVKLFTDKIRSAYQNGNFKRLIAIGFGKAACVMAKAVEDELGYLISAGVVITKYGHTIEQQNSRTAEQQGQRKRLISSSHPPLNPLPSREGRQAEMLPSREGKITRLK